MSAAPAVAASIRAVTRCPLCGALPGRRCRTASGVVTRNNHAARDIAYLFTPHRRP